MPGPLGVHPDNPQNSVRLSHLQKATPVQVPEPGGRPTDVNTLQMEAEFDPVLGEGTWSYWLYPNTQSWDQYDKFRAQMRRYLSFVDEFTFDTLMDYLHNFKTVNIDLKTGNYYAVVPRPKGYVYGSS